MDLKELYDELYNEGYHSGKKNHGLIQVGQLLLDCDFDTFLDVGCSQGAMVKAMQLAGKDAYGMDISSTAVERSKELGLTTCVQGYAEEIPFEDNAFDLVFSSDVLEHIPYERTQKAVNELLRVAKKYVAVNISFGPEINRKWATVAKNKGYNIENLHLTVMEKAAWLRLFQKNTNWKLLHDYNKLTIFTNT